MSYGTDAGKPVPAFTPGPWSKRWAANGDCGIFSPAARGCVAECFVEIHEAGLKSPDVEANARLIASAPEMFEALQSYSTAFAMPQCAAPIAFERPKATFDISYGGGVCDKHGAYYGSCAGCDSDYRQAQERADSDAKRDREQALASSVAMARAALLKATGGQS